MFNTNHFHQNEQISSKTAGPNWSFQQKSEHGVASWLSRAPLTFISTDAWDMTHAGRRPAWIKCGILYVSVSAVTILECRWGLFNTFPSQGTHNLLRKYSCNRFHLSQNAFIILPVPDLATVHVYLHQSACQTWLRILDCSSETPLTWILVRDIHGAAPGLHATGLLLETWTLGNAGIYSRALYNNRSETKTTKRELKKDS